MAISTSAAFYLRASMIEQSINLDNLTSEQQQQIEYLVTSPYKGYKQTASAKKLLVGTRQYVEDDLTTTKNSYAHWKREIDAKCYGSKKATKKSKLILTHRYGITKSRWDRISNLKQIRLITPHQRQLREDQARLDNAMNPFLMPSTDSCDNNITNLLQNRQIQLVSPSEQQQDREHPEHLDSADFMLSFLDAVNLKLEAYVHELTFKFDHVIQQLQKQTTWYESTGTHPGVSQRKEEDFIKSKEKEEEKVKRSKSRTFGWISAEAFAISMKWRRFLSPGIVKYYPFSSKEKRPFKAARKAALAARIILKNKREIVEQEKLYQDEIKMFKARNAGKEMPRLHNVLSALPAHVRVWKEAAFTDACRDESRRLSAAKEAAETGTAVRDIPVKNGQFDIGCGRIEFAQEGKWCGIQGSKLKNELPNEEQTERQGLMERHVQQEETIGECSKRKRGGEHEWRCSILDKHCAKKCMRNLRSIQEDCLSIIDDDR